MSNGSLPAQSRPTWTNWTENIVHQPPTDGSNYYFAPNTLSELKAVLQQAITDKAVLRVSGQRHSQPPLVISANALVPGAKNYLVDLSCYADLGPNGDQNMVVDVANKKITVNTGVREDQVAALLTKNNLMMRTVTAGGFFSLGGMTSVDVHGATTAAPIFAGTVSAFTILRADGSVVTIDVLDRPYATTLLGGSTSLSPSGRSQFAAEMQTLRDRCKPVAADGHFELYKVSLKFDNPEARLAHGFPIDQQSDEVKEWLLEVQNEGHAYPVIPEP